MMFFGKRRFNREWDDFCISQFNDNIDLVRAKDLVAVDTFGPRHDQRDYVATVGLFREDMFFINIPYITWFVRSDGNIWAEWVLSIPPGDPAYKRLKKTHVVKNGSNARPATSGNMHFTVPMSQNSIATINSFSQELWTLHKMGSTTLL